MLNRVQIILFITIFLVGSYSLCAQGNPDPYKNRVILKYYDKNELLNIETNLPQKFKQLKNYYIHSFIATSITCSACNAPNLSLVDVREFEQYRQIDNPVTISDTIRGFKITLVSKNQLERMNNSTWAPNDFGVRAGMIYNSSKNTIKNPFININRKK